MKNPEQWVMFVTAWWCGIGLGSYAIGAFFHVLWLKQAASWFGLLGSLLLALLVLVVGGSIVVEDLNEKRKARNQQREGE